MTLVLAFLKISKFKFKICINSLELALFMFKFQAKQLPSSFLDYFKFTNAIHAKQTRSSTTDNYFLSRYKTVKLQRSINSGGQ